VDFPIMIGRRLKRVDIVIFRYGMPHTQEYAYILAKTNSEDIKPSHKKNGIDQLKSYLSACPRAKYGLWVGSERITIKVVEKEGRKEFVNIPDLLDAGKIEPPKVDSLSLS
ncbi:MAG: type I restriction enzyme HsdR N-terminal domain-containing protein, partial [Thermoprotei archaeon]